MSNGTELVKWSVTPAGSMALKTINWLENNSPFINLFSQYLLSISHVSAFALVMVYSDEQDWIICGLMLFSF